MSEYEKSLEAHIELLQKMLAVRERSDYLYFIKYKNNEIQTWMENLQKYIDIYECNIRSCELVKVFG